MPNEYVNRILEDEFVPTQALIIYSRQKAWKNYIELHQIKNGRLMCGKPLTNKCIQELVNTFKVDESITPKGIIPERLLYIDQRVGYDCIIWYNPPCKRKMYFSKSLGIDTGEYHVPGVIYQVTNEQLNMYAFKGTKPTPESTLYQAPFFNVTGSSVCMGTAKATLATNPTFDDLLDYWEEKFWSSQFTHLGGGGNPTRDNLVLVTKRSKRSFDQKQLILSAGALTLQNLYV